MNQPAQPIVNPSEAELLPAIRQRYSPYRFEPREVEDHKIRLCLEAARWASSSFNDQPWSWLVARRQDTAAFDEMLGCLLEANQGWAKYAGVLLIGVTRSAFRYNDKPNRVALHDLGQAAAYLAVQAVQLELQIHQMAGLNLSKTRQQYEIPEGYDPQTAIAIGYPDRSEPESDVEKEFHRRESGARDRLPLKEQVFERKWGKTSGFLS